MDVLRLAIAALIMFIAISCGDHHKQKNTEASALVDILNTPDTSMLPGANYIKNEEQPQKEQEQPDKTGARNGWEKKIIKNATLNLEVENHLKYNSDIHQLIKRWEAYISDEQKNSTDYKVESLITIKIPVQFFDEAVQQLSGHNGKVLVKDITSLDVSGEYYDAKTRMEAKKRIRFRYLDLLQRAKNIEEILEVEKEINSIQEQMEAAAGRADFLSQSAAYSTIYLTFFQITNATSADSSKPGFGRRILTAFSSGLKWMSELLIIIVTLWPLWIALAAGILLLRKIVSYKAKLGC